MNVDATDALFAGGVVTPHQSTGDLEILLPRGFARPQDALHAGRVHGEGFLHKDIHAFLDDVLEMNRSKRGRRCQQHQVRFTEDSDGFLEDIKPNEPAPRRHVDLGRGFLGEILEAVIQAML
jgi:hypothetical protein